MAYKPAPQHGKSPKFYPFLEPFPDFLADFVQFGLFHRKFTYSLTHFLEALICGGMPKLINIRYDFQFLQLWNFGFLPMWAQMFVFC